MILSTAAITSAWRDRRRTTCTRYIPWYRYLVLLVSETKKDAKTRANAPNTHTLDDGRTGIEEWEMNKKKNRNEWQCRKRKFAEKREIARERTAVTGGQTSTTDRRERPCDARGGDGQAKSSSRRRSRSRSRSRRRRAYTVCRRVGRATAQRAPHTHTRSTYA